jgi:AcrR family transcriptional regulator
MTGQPCSFSRTPHARTLEPAGRVLDLRAVGTRAAIVAAATVLFLRHGYQGTSVEAIAGLAAVTDIVV